MTTKGSTTTLDRQVPRDATSAATKPAEVYLVLPAYNEEDALPLLLGRVERLRDRLEAPLSVVLVDDGSTDNTLMVAEVWSRKMNLRVVPHEVNAGLGVTIRDGILEALALARPEDVVVTMDADNTHSPELIDDMLEKIKEGYDFVIASRYRRGSRIQGLSPFRRVLSYGASVVFRLALPVEGVRDYTCGYRAHRARLLQDVVAAQGDDFCARPGFECMVDLLLSAHAHGAKFTEVPFELRYDRKEGASKMRVVKTVCSLLKLLASWRLKRFRG